MEEEKKISKEKKAEEIKNSFIKKRLKKRYALSSSSGSKGHKFMKKKSVCLFCKFGGGEYGGIRGKSFYRFHSV